MEACETAHYWARELSALGHNVRLMPPAYVKPYVKRQKNDAADAEAICEAVPRQTMRFVPIKSVEQQSAAMLHRSRALLVKQRKMLLHSIRSSPASSFSFDSSPASSSASKSGRSRNVSSPNSIRNSFVVT